MLNWLIIAHKLTYLTWYDMWYDTYEKHYPICIAIWQTLIHAMHLRVYLSRLPRIFIESSLWSSLGSSNVQSIVKSIVFIHVKSTIKTQHI